MNATLYDEWNKNIIHLKEYLLDMKYVHPMAQSEKSNSPFPHNFESRIAMMRSAAWPSPNGLLAFAIA